MIESIHVTLISFFWALDTIMKQTGTFYCHIPVNSQLTLIISWINDKTGQPLKYTNFYYNIRRQFNEKCAVIYLGSAKDHYNRPLSGYWFYKPCDAKLRTLACQSKRDESKIFNCHEWSLPFNDYSNLKNFIVSA